MELVRRNGRPVAGFGLGGASRLEWVAMRDKLQDTDALIATGRGDTLVDGHTAIEMARLLRERMSAGLGDLGVGHPEPPPPPHPSPWKYALVMSFVSAATGWALEGIARRFRKRGRR